MSEPTNHTYPNGFDHADQPGVYPEGVERGTVNMGVTKEAYRTPDGRVYAKDKADGQFRLTSARTDAPTFVPDGAE